MYAVTAFFFASVVLLHSSIWVALRSREQTIYDDVWLGQSFWGWEATILTFLAGGTVLSPYFMYNVCQSEKKLPRRFIVPNRNPNIGKSDVDSAFAQNSRWSAKFRNAVLEIGRPISRTAVSFGCDSVMLCTAEQLRANEAVTALSLLPSGLSVFRH
ncbi:MAG: hypothetical protein ACI9BW_003563 [Gammaproteobacteria bacterium]